MQIKTEIPQDEKLHSVLLSDGLKLFGDLIESHDYWIFVADMSARNLLRDVMQNHYANSLPGDAHSLVFPMGGALIVLVALRKTFMSPKQLSRHLRRQAGLNLSANETAKRDLFIAVSADRIPIAMALIEQITGEAKPSPAASPWAGTGIYGNPN